MSPSSSLLEEPKSPSAHAISMKMNWMWTSNSPTNPVAKNPNWRRSSSPSWSSFSWKPWLWYHSPSESWVWKPGTHSNCHSSLSLSQSLCRSSNSAKRYCFSSHFIFYRKFSNVYWNFRLSRSLLTILTHKSLLMDLGMLPFPPTTEPADQWMNLKWTHKRWLTMLMLKNVQRYLVECVLRLNMESSL